MQVAGIIARRATTPLSLCRSRFMSIHATPWIYANPAKPTSPSTVPCTRSVCHTRKPKNPAQINSNTENNKLSETNPDNKNPKPNETQKPPTPLRPPEKWLYKHVLSTSRRWLTEVVGRAFVASTNSNRTDDVGGARPKLPIHNNIAMNSHQKPDEAPIASQPSRPPDRWLYKHVLATSRRWWTDIVDRAFVATNSNASRSDDSRPTVQSLDQAKKVASADLDDVQQKINDIIKIIRTKSGPALIVTRRGLEVLRGNAVQVILKLEETSTGLKMSVPVRRFLQESCDANLERIKYVQQIQSMKKKEEGCGGGQNNPTDCCDPYSAAADPKDSCKA